jgi:protein gp37
MSTTIQWTDETWNPTRGCSRVSEGCRNCYAERIAARFSLPGNTFHGFAVRTPEGPRWTGEVTLLVDRLDQPLSWKLPRRVFVNSMSDLFHEHLGDDDISQVFAIMALCPQHTFQILTKRAERMRDYVQEMSTDPDAYCFAWARQYLRGDGRRTPELRSETWPLPNVWLGVSVEDQGRADERIPLLLQTPAAIRFISAEPLLGPIDLRRWLSGYSEECGSLRLSGRPDGRAGDRRGRADLASVGAAREPMDRSDDGSAVQTAESRARQGLPERQGDGRPEASDGAGASTGLAPLQRADSGWPDRESRERHQIGQQADESDAGDAFGADEACDERARLRPNSQSSQRLSWVIVGGESGPGARPFNIEWARSILAECKSAGVAAFMKQVGAKPDGWWTNELGPRFNRHALTLDKAHGGNPSEWPPDLNVRQFPASPF